MTSKSREPAGPRERVVSRARKLGRLEHQYDGSQLVYRDRADELKLTLVNGLRVIVPRRLVCELIALPKSVAKEMRLGVQGGAIEVRSRDIDISVRGLLRDLVGAIAARGGRARTPG
jgi:hypothetical protein